MEEKTERLIADTVLEASRTVSVAGRTYVVAPPTLATIIELSGKAAQLPRMPQFENEEQVLAWVTGNARQCGVIADIIALLLHGAAPEPRRKLLGIPLLPARTRQETARHILGHCTPKECFELLSDCIGMQEIGFFLTIIATLQGAEILRRTTPSGQ